MQWLIRRCGRVKKAETLREGSRNNDLFKYACSLRGKGADYSKLAAELTEYNKNHVKPPVDEAELTHIIDQAMKYEPNTSTAQTDDTSAPKNTKSAAPRKERLTLASLVEEMQLMNCQSRYNLVSKEYETIGHTETGRALTQDDLITLLHDTLADRYKGCAFDTISMYVAYNARENSYNPVLDELASIEWDCVDRLPELYMLMGIAGDDDDSRLSQSLVLKWLMQSVALLFNNQDAPFGADGCLVLNGDQGKGKTSLFRHLAMKDAWFGEGQTINDRDKDSTRRILSVWIA